jgi:hypothetical protein
MCSSIWRIFILPFYFIKTTVLSEAAVFAGGVVEGRVTCERNIGIHLFFDYVLRFARHSAQGSGLVVMVFLLLTLT